MKMPFIFKRAVYLKIVAYRVAGVIVQKFQGFCFILGLSSIDSALPFRSIP